MIQATAVKPEVAVSIEEDVRQILQLMGFAAVQVQCRGDRESYHVQIEAGEAGKMLIGSGGAHLQAFQHVIRCLLRRRLQESVRVVIDVNHYRSRREQGLLNLAEEIARKAQRTGHTVVLRPMPAADRRAIHTALARYKHVTTESLGEEPNRRVVVRPVFL